MSPRWRYFLLGYLWLLPVTLVGLVLGLVYRAHSWRWSDGCLEAIGGDRIIGKPAAQTIGWVVFYRSEADRDITVIRVHERIHVVQGFIGGPLFALAYMALTGYRALRYDMPTAYWRNEFERHAYDNEHNAGAWGSARD